MNKRAGKIHNEILKMIELHGMGLTIEDLAYALGVEIAASGSI